MTYAIFRTKHTFEEYFDHWDSVNYEKITDATREKIYKKYLVKCDVFTRDNFLCANTECKFPESSLTLHHVRFQKNGGKDSVRNCITLCQTCHKSFHRGKRRIVLSDNPLLPTHMQGHTYDLSGSDEIDWKKIRIEMKKFRKTLTHEHSYLSLEQIEVLWKFLEMTYHDGSDD